LAQIAGKPVHLCQASDVSETAIYPSAKPLCQMKLA
jgi:hypothetical protein